MEAQEFGGALRICKVFQLRSSASRWQLTLAQV